MKNKLPFVTGDILYNLSAKRFIYIHESSFITNRKFERDNKFIQYRFSVIGFSGSIERASASLFDLSLFLTRYGNIDNMSIATVELLKLDITSGISTELGLRVNKLNRDLKMSFLMSY